MPKRSRKPVNYIALSGNSNKGKVKAQDEEDKRVGFFATRKTERKTQAREPEPRVYSLEDFMNNKDTSQFVFEKDNSDEFDNDIEFDQITTSAEKPYVPDKTTYENEIEIEEIQDIDEYEQQHQENLELPVDYDEVVIEDVSQSDQEESNNTTPTKMKARSNENYDYSNEIMKKIIEDDEDNYDDSSMRSNTSTCSSSEKSPRSRDKRIEYSGLSGSYWNLDPGSEKRRALQISLAGFMGIGIKKKNKTPEKQPQASPPKPRQKYVRKNKSYVEEPDPCSSSSSLFAANSRSSERTSQERKSLKRKSETFIPQRDENNKIIKKQSTTEGRNQIDDNNFKYNSFERKFKEFQENMNENESKVSDSHAENVKLITASLSKEEIEKLKSLDLIVSETPTTPDKNRSQSSTSSVKFFEKSPSYSIVKDKFDATDQSEEMEQTENASKLKLKLKLVSELQHVEKRNIKPPPSPEMPTLSPIAMDEPLENEAGNTRTTRIMTRKRKSIDRFYVSKKDVIISALSVPKEYASKTPINFLNDIKNSVEKTDYKEIVDFSVKKKIIKKPIEKVQQNKPKHSTGERLKLMQHLVLDKPVKSKRKIHHKEKLIRKEILDGKREAHLKDSDVIISFDPNDEAKIDSPLVLMSPSEEIAVLPSPYTLSQIESVHENIKEKGGEDAIQISVICKMPEGACRLGCVCLSLNFPVVDKEHCGKLHCLLRCKCHDPYAWTEELITKTRLRPRVTMLNMKDMHKNTGFDKINEDDDGSSRSRKRKRNVNAPKHFGDFVMEDENGIPVKRGSKKALELIKKQNKILAQQNKGEQQQKTKVLKKRVKKRRPVDSSRSSSSSSASPSKSKRTIKNSPQNVTDTICIKPKRKVNGEIKPKYNRDLILANLTNTLNKFQSTTEALSMQEVTMKGSDYNEIYKVYENQGNEICYFAWNFSQETPPLVGQKYRSNGVDPDKILILPIPNIGHQWLLLQVDQYFLDKSFMVVPTLRVIIDTEELNEAFEWANDNDVTTNLKMPNYPHELGKLYVLPHLPRLIAIGPVNCNVYKNIVESDALNETCCLGSRFLSICQDNEKSEGLDIMQFFQEYSEKRELNESDYREFIEPIPADLAETVSNSLLMSMS